MTYVSKRPPRAWQAQCLPIMWGRRAFAVLAGMRTGKTKVIVDDWGRLVAENMASDLVVIGPGGAYLPWRDALKADLPNEIQASLRIFVWESMRAKIKTVVRERDLFLGYRGPRALIINSEALSMISGARQFVLEYVKQRPQRCYVAIDESVIVKSPKSKIGKFVGEEIGPKAGYRRILSGLVSPRAPSDLWNQFRFLDPNILGYADFTTFQVRYEKIKRVCMLPNVVLYARLRALAGDPIKMTKAQLQWRAYQINSNLDARNMDETPLRAWVSSMIKDMPRDRAIETINRMGGYVPAVPVLDAKNPFQNVDELRAKIEPHAFRVRLEDCYDMPPVDYAFRDVALTPEQKRLYGEMKKNATTKLESLDHVTATHVIVQMLRLHQILCGHIVDEQGVVHDVSENRTTELCDMLEDYDGKAIIWVSYDRSVDKVVAALEKRFGENTVSRFWGGNVKTRETEEMWFKTEPDRRFMVSTPDAGGRGRDWSVADWVIYFSNRNNLDHRSQSEDRAKAVGKTRPMAYTDMRVQGTVEDPILRCLRNKLDMAATINGDQWREWII
jgi:hypothetical protein